MAGPCWTYRPYEQLQHAPGSLLQVLESQYRGCTIEVLVVELVNRKEYVPREWMPHEEVLVDAQLTAHFSYFVLEALSQGLPSVIISSCTSIKTHRSSHFTNLNQFQALAVNHVVGQRQVMMRLDGSRTASSSASTPRKHIILNSVMARTGPSLISVCKSTF
jgi:hypothetical protein